MSINSAALHRFGHLVRERRLELGLSQDQVTEAGGPSDKRQTQIENGTPPAPRVDTLAKLDTALRWKPGSAAAALRSGEPPVPQEAQRFTQEQVDRRVALAVALQRAGVTNAATRGAGRGASGELDDATIDALIEVLNSLPPKQ